MRIGLIGCSKSKYHNNAVPAKEMYKGQLFKKSFEFCRKHNIGKIFILSALYRVLQPEELINQYNLTLNDFSKKEKDFWGMQVVEQLKKLTDIENDRFIFLCGKNYWKPILDQNKIGIYELPLYGLGLGKSLQFLSNL